MMNVIINKGLVDTDYVERYTVGYDELAERVQQTTRRSGRRRSPASRPTTSSPWPASTPPLQPAAIRIGVAIERHAGGGQTVRSIACLPALVGAWRHVGGGILQLPLWAFPIKWDRAARRRPDPARHPSASTSSSWARRSPASSTSTRRSRPCSSTTRNPVTQASHQDKTLAGLARDDLFTVVSEQFLTDTADYADIVLPATTQLEQFDICSPGATSTSR